MAGDWWIAVLPTVRMRTKNTGSGDGGRICSRGEEMGIHCNDDGAKVEGEQAR